jgi:hypothetical protein
MGPDADQEQRLHAALVDELMRRSAMCWVRLPDADRDHAVWHVWHEGAAYVVTGGAEQPLPGVASARRATVVARSKETRQRMLAWEAEVAQVRPDDAEWPTVTKALLAARLNLHDLEQAAERWARECVVVRLAPTGVLTEQPGALPEDDRSAPPAPTPATTRRGLPRVVHRRQTRRPDLRAH